MSEEEVAFLRADVVPSTSRLRPNVQTRAIARTRQSERVRATVNRNRITTAQRIQVLHYQGDEKVYKLLSSELSIICMYQV